MRGGYGPDERASIRRKRRRARQWPMASDDDIADALAAFYRFLTHRLTQETAA